MDIPWTNELTELVQKLAELYPREDSATPIIDQASINKSNLNYEDKAPAVRWHAIVFEAKHQDKLLNLIDEARKPYPNDETLKKLRDYFAERKNGGQQQRDSSELNTFSARLGEERLRFKRIVAPRKPHEISKEDVELLTTRKIHWDREYPTKIYLGMIRLEQDFQILSIEASEKEDLGSLLERYEEICRILTDQYDYSILCARIPLAETIETGSTIAKDILKELMNAVLRSNTSQMDDCYTDLDDMRKVIDQRAAGDRNTSFTPASLASELTGCLRSIARKCTIVLLISNIERLVNPDNELRASGKWLMKNWLADEVRNTPGLVVVVTGEKGLADVARWHENGVYHIPELDPMDLSNLIKWVRDGYGFDWSDESIKTVWKDFNTVALFRKYLDLQKKLSELEAPAE